MKKVLYIVIIGSVLLVILFFQFIKLDKEFEGTWVGEYSTYSEKNATNLFLAEQSLLKFENNRCFLRDPNFYDTTEIKKSDYIFHTNTIIFDSEVPEEYHIQKAEYDSLVLESPDGAYVHVYRKLSDTLKHNKRITFTGKKFLLKNEIFQDSLYFENDSSLIKMSAKNEKYRNFIWNQVRFNGFDILFVEGNVPYVVVGQDGDSTELLTFHKTPLKHTMIEIR